MENLQGVDSYDESAEMFRLRWVSKVVDVSRTTEDDRLRQCSIDPEREYPHDGDGAGDLGGCLRI